MLSIILINLISNQGLSDILPIQRLVNQMASVSIEKEQKLTYDVVKEEDAENVLKLLKATFFQVNFFPAENSIKFLHLGLQYFYCCILFHSPTSQENLFHY